MKGAERSRAEVKGPGALRQRCPRCRKLRKRNEPPGDQGGERHPRRPAWGHMPGIGTVCGWCLSSRAQDRRSKTTIAGRPLRLTAATTKALAVLKEKGRAGVTPGFFADLMSYGGRRNHGRVGGRVLESLKRRGYVEGFASPESVWHYAITEAGVKALEREAAQ